MRVHGLDLHVELDGSESSLPLVLLHGFTGSSATWCSVTPALRSHARLVLLDVIVHGASEAPSEHERYTLEWAVRDLLALLDALAIEQTDVLGYSMGGRLALRFALDAPERVRRLVLESASPGIADPAERARRLEADVELAERIERDGLERFVDEWERQPLLALADDVSAEVRERQHALRLQSSARGLANSLRGMSAGRQTPLWDRLPSLAAPTLLIVGARDARYCAMAAEMQAALPHAALQIVSGAGHTVHIDRPSQFTAAVTDFLRG